MEEGELVKEFLGDMPVVRFIALYVFALAGMILFFTVDIIKAVRIIYLKGGCQESSAT
jgi:hypothetical protein